MKWDGTGTSTFKVAFYTSFLWTFAAKSDDAFSWASVTLSEQWRKAWGRCVEIESLGEREATTYSHGVRWLERCMESTTLISGMQGWRDIWRISSCEGLHVECKRKKIQLWILRVGWLVRGVNSRSKSWSRFTNLSRFSPDYCKP